MVAVNRAIEGAGTSADAWRADAALMAVPETDCAQLVGAATRVVIVAPHPDDEILACGGLLQQLAARAMPVLIVAVTDGEASHPGSATWTRARLQTVRPDETMAALALLGLADVPVLRLALPDGGVALRETELARMLANIMTGADLVLTTWRHDGHPDHEATARACATAAGACGAKLIEAPIWGWHWSRPEDATMPFAHARRLMLTGPELQRKRAALACFESQLVSDDASGHDAILTNNTLERLLNPFEMVFI
ncbi:MAG: PIG-L family deacetylase [Pseudomonadota bacterium]|nr:PIG-L family deacetylase [Pseudomonadota bacterium]